MQQIGRYRIEGELGRGAMGVVYKAVDPAIGRVVAIKTIRLSDIAEAQERARLQERLLLEARSAGQLSHPGIVTIYDAGEEGDVSYFAMEYVDGQSVESLLASGAVLNRNQILDILRQTAAALDYAHKKGIVHRDIKPANIMIGSDAVVKVTDFGVAKVSSSTHRTAAGAVLGTPNYMSPEQLRGKEITGAVDQFALAVVTYELLTGERPFAAEELAAVFLKIISEEPPAPSLLNATLGPGVDRVIAKALSKQPEHRYANCVAFVNALEQALAPNPLWRGAARGASQSMPTVAGEEAVTFDGLAEGKLEAAKPKVGRPRIELPPLPPARPRPRSRWPLALVTLAILFLIGGAWWVLATPGGQKWLASVGGVMRVPENQGDDGASGGGVGKAHGDSGAREIPPAPKQEADEEPPDALERLAAGSLLSETAGDGRAPRSASTAPPAEAAPPAPVSIRPRPTSPARELPPVEATLQNVTVTVNPPGAQVIFDDRVAEACTAPCSAALEPGRHSISVSRRGYRSAFRVFEVRNAAVELTVTLEQPMGNLLVSSDPPGAFVVLNGRRQAERTPATLRLAAGSYKVSVEKEGFAAQEQAVQVRDEAYLRLDFQLSPR